MRRRRQPERQRSRSTMRSSWQTPHCGATRNTVTRARCSSSSEVRSSRRPGDSPDFDVRNAPGMGLDGERGRCQDDGSLISSYPGDPMLRSIIIAAAGMLAVAPAALAQDSIKIAVVGPMAFAQGENAWAGAEMARDEIHKGGGISAGGKKLKIELVAFTATG